MRYLAQYIISNSLIYKLSTCEFSDNLVSIKLFKTECAATTYINGIVVIGNEKLLGHSIQIHSIFNVADDLSKIADEILSYMEKNKLFNFHDLHPTVLKLVRE